MRIIDLFVTPRPSDVTGICAKTSFQRLLNELTCKDIWQLSIKYIIDVKKRNGHRVFHSPMYMQNEYSFRCYPCQLRTQCCIQREFWSSSTIRHIKIIEIFVLQYTCCIAKIKKEILLPQQRSKSTFCYVIYKRFVGIIKSIHFLIDRQS